MESRPLDYPTTEAEILWAAKKKIKKQQKRIFGHDKKLNDYSYLTYDAACLP